MVVWVVEFISSVDPSSCSSVHVEFDVESVVVFELLYEEELDEEVNTFALPSETPKGGFTDQA